MATLSFNEATKVATYTFKNGRQLVVKNMTKQKAEEFLQRDAPEFERRDCRMESVGGTFNREEGGNGG
jgi:hypothetical protein